MNVSFYVNYYTAPGERLFLLGSLDSLGGDQPSRARAMTSVEGEGWLLQCELAADVRAFTYRYLVMNEEGAICYEPWDKRHELVLEAPCASVFLYDYWHLLPDNPFFYGSSAFTKHLFAHEIVAAPAVTSSRLLVLRLFHPYLRRGEQLAIAGNQPCVGSWTTEGAALLSQTAPSQWEVRLNADEITFPFEYKYFVCDKERRVLHWEQGENRSFGSLPDQPSEMVVLSDYPYRDASPLWRGAGVMVPLFSLRSESSFGVGDFHDLKLLVDWAAATDQCLIQLLPINDTTRTATWRDSYPYSGVSVYAIHPIYLSLDELMDKDDPVMRLSYQQLQKRLNEKETLDYESVLREKKRCIKDYFDRVADEVMSSDAFQLFFQKHAAWLKPYGAFCYLREKYQTADFSQWGEDAVYDASRIERLYDVKGEAYPELALHLFTQYLLDRQLMEVVDYAHSRGVVLKGDLPIGVHRMSVETWRESDYFNMGGQAGAPPDNFSLIGQNWSFPTYNWRVMEEDGYRWWKSRLSRLSDYFDCLRIDHILGFFRIWEIPLDYLHGLCGHFNPALPYSKEEIAAFDFLFKEIYCVPHLHRCQLSSFFGAFTDEVITTYLEEMEEERFRLRSFCDTQRKIEALFSERDDQASTCVKECLLMFCDEVLFLRDASSPGMFHPRIVADHSWLFQLLSPEEQHAFQRLYHHFFYERHATLWHDEGGRRLTPLVHSTDMLVCGEDLGMIPDMVHPMMERLHILTLELGRLSKQAGCRFTDLQKIPYWSVCTTSTHDMPTLRGWWEEDEACRNQYYHNVLKEEGEAPSKCTSSIAQAILEIHLNAVSMLAIIPLQDWLSISDDLRLPDASKEQVNVPADPNHYWRYRMHLTIEELLNSKELNQKIRLILSSSGRS